MASVQKINQILQRRSSTCAGVQHNWTVESAANRSPGYFVARLSIPDPFTEGNKIVFVGKSALGKKAAQHDVAVQALQWLEHTENPLHHFLDKTTSGKQSGQPQLVVDGSGSPRAPGMLEPKVEKVDDGPAVGFQGELASCHSSVLQDRQEVSPEDHSKKRTGPSVNDFPDKQKVLELMCSFFGVDYCKRSTTFRSILHCVIQKWWKPLPQVSSPAIVWDVSYVINTTQSGYVATLHLNFTETNSRSVQLHQFPPQSFQFDGSPAISKRLAMENTSEAVVLEFYKFFPEQQFNYGAKKELNVFLQKALRPSAGQSLYNYVIEKQPGSLHAVEFRCTIQIRSSFMQTESMVREVTGEWMATAGKAKENAAQKVLNHFVNGLWSTADGFIISPTIKEPQSQPYEIKQEDVGHCDVDHLPTPLVDS